MDPIIPQGNAHLIESISHTIRTRGPMGLDDYMAHVLYHPTQGYYATCPVIGAEGDFITAPEITPLFAYCLAEWTEAAWHRMGRPPHWQLLELGPGRGTLMAQLLDRLQTYALPAPSIVLYETNPAMQALQAERLQQSGFHCAWHPDLSSLAPLPTIIIGNEFCDALPAKRYGYYPSGWAEQRLALSADGWQWQPYEAAIPEHIQRLPSPAVASIIEDIPSLLPIMNSLLSHITQHSGACLIIDYGGRRESPPYHSTLQAVHRHHYCSPFAHIGSADLTTHVDFGLLASIAQDWKCHALYQTQRSFLMQHHIMRHALSYLDARNEKGNREAEIILQSAIHRLISLEQMGSLFKTLQLYSGSLDKSA